MAKIFQRLSAAALQKRKVALLTQLLPPANLLHASYVRQYLTCGKKNCRCQRGFKHGPFYYLVQCRRDGSIGKFLLKTSGQREQVRNGIAAYKKFQNQLAELSAINTELVRGAGSKKPPRSSR